MNLTKTDAALLINHESDTDDLQSVWLIETSCGLIREITAYEQLDAIIETQSAGFRPIRCEWRRYV
jgi:hypothetical protein